MIDIGEMVHRTGLPPSTLHVWEREGLIEPVGRAGLRRQYGDDAIQRVAVIVTAQRSGFTLAEIRDLLTSKGTALRQERLATKLAALEQRRQDLNIAITGLRHALACTAPSPMECPTFLSSLDSVLPVDKTTENSP